MASARKNKVTDISNRNEFPQWDGWAQSTAAALQNPGAPDEDAWASDIDVSAVRFSGLVAGGLGEDPGHFIIFLSDSILCRNSGTLGCFFSFFAMVIIPLYLLHLTGSIIVSCHAAALLFNLHGSGLEEAISDRPLCHVTSAVAPNFHL